MELQPILLQIVDLAPKGVRFLNENLILALTLGALLLLRPVTRRIFNARQQARLWLLAWFFLTFQSMYDLMGQLSFPYTFRNLLAVPIYGATGIYQTLPLFFNGNVNANVGQQIFYLPGGSWMAVSVSDTVLGLFALVCIAVRIGLFLWAIVQRRRLIQIGRAGVPMSVEEKEKYGLDSTVAVRRCKGLDTSFVREGNDTGWRDGVNHVICLQDDLPEERMKLVLRHEKEHIEQKHPFLKALLTIMLYLNWWNPVVWLAYRITCRDMELACDEAVMEQLAGPERREYARTLVDLAYGKHMWGGITTFGECDAAIRVRRLANWKERKAGERHLTDLLVLVLILFFFCGNSGSVDRAPVVSDEQTKQLQAEWEMFIYGPAFVADLRDVFGEDTRIAEMWESQENTVLERIVFVKTTDGEWLRCSYRFHEDGSHAGSGMSGGYLVDEEDLEEYIRIQ